MSFMKGLIATVALGSVATCTYYAQAQDGQFQTVCVFNSSDINPLKFQAKWNNRDTEFYSIAPGEGIALWQPYSGALYAVNIYLKQSGVSVRNVDETVAPNITQSKTDCSTGTHYEFVNKEAHHAHVKLIER